MFLKQLKSGLLLVTGKEEHVLVLPLLRQHLRAGPYKLNGVPLRRVNQAYVVATSTKVDVSGVTLDDKFNDAYFKAPAKKPQKKTAEGFFKEEKKAT